jgi:carbonic anhydrase/acetyltransferase-like protein (isoleucine patch superfamily)
MNQSIYPYQGIYPTLGRDVYIAPMATVIGNVELGDDVSVWPGAVIRGDMHSITVGARSNIQDRAVLHVTHASDYNPEGYSLTIGENVVVGHGAILHGCTLGDRVLVGNGAIVNDGVVIEDEVVVGAGCVVPPGKKLSTGFVYVGNPCKSMRRLSSEETSFFTYSATSYVRLKDQYLAQVNN